MSKDNNPQPGIVYPAKVSFKISMMKIFQKNRKGESLPPTDAY